MGLDAKNIVVVYMLSAHVFSSLSCLVLNQYVVYLHLAPSVSLLNFMLLAVLASLPHPILGVVHTQSLAPPYFSNNQSHMNGTVFDDDFDRVFGISCIIEPFLPQL